MLKHLSIKNFALIQDIDVHFDRQLNMITGETGAGKSMLLGALGLILGQRADLQVIGNNGDKCTIEGLFDITGLELEEFFKLNDLDYANETNVRRELNSAGKSRCFINDTPVSLQQLKDFASNLVSFHSQHENLSLGNMDFQFMVVDHFAGNEAVLNDFQVKRKNLKGLATEIAQLSLELKKNTGDEDYNRHLLNELEVASIKSGEYEELEAEQLRLANAGSLIAALAQSFELLEADENGLLDQNRKFIGLLESIRRYDPDMAGMIDNLQNSFADLQQYARDIGRKLEEINVDESRLAELNSRLQLIHDLCRKHRLNTAEELLTLQHSLRNQLSGTENSAELLLAKEQQYQIEKERLKGLANDLHKKREAVIPILQNEINSTLAKVGMNHAVLKAELSELENDELNNFGMHGLRFMFAPNPGSPFLPLEKIASGGELSRIMLVIKSLIAGVQRLPTLIFDEIDTGISGETALKVGRLMHDMARSHQLICITHLPQIACFADEQYHILKIVENGSTTTLMKQLSDSDRERELARMIGGDQFSEKALENARELMAMGR